MMNSEEGRTLLIKTFKDKLQPKELDKLIQQFDGAIADLTDPTRSSE